MLTFQREHARLVNGAALCEGFFMKVSQQVLGWIFCLSFSVTEVAGATNFISGDVTSSATWTGANLLTGTVIVRADAVVIMREQSRKQISILPGNIY